MGREGTRQSLVGVEALPIVHEEEGDSEDDSKSRPGGGKECEE